ncbi:MAG: hypothetical protein QG635_1176 [Bacteroidota bacterium]|nr:hypothetical protein [Bacteroidota bacterium]
MKDVHNSEHSTKNSNSWITVLLSNFFKTKFIAGAVIPALILYITSKYDLLLYGALISSVWAVGAVAIEYIWKRSINFIAIITAFYAAIQFAVTAITKNPDWYFISAVLEDLLYAAIALISLMFKRPLVQVIVEEVAIAQFSPEFRKAKEYRQAWVIITIFIALKNVVDFFIKGSILYFAPIEVFIGFRPVYNQITTIMAVIFYFWFPGWYWDRKRKSGDSAAE